jgi:Mg2+-importing ATPase
LTELVIALVVRTRCPFWRSRPGKMLLISSAIMIGDTLVIPYLPIDAIFGFVPLPVPLTLAMIGLTLAYVVAVEIAKKFFYARQGGAKK